MRRQRQWQRGCSSGGIEKAVVAAVRRQWWRQREGSNGATAAATAAGVSVSTLHGAIAHGYKCAGNRYRKRDAAMLIYGLKT